MQQAQSSISPNSRHTKCWSFHRRLQESDSGVYTASDERKHKILDGSVQEYSADVGKTHVPTVMCSRNKHHLVNLWPRSRTERRLLGSLVSSSKRKHTESVIQHAIFHSAYPRATPHRSSGLISRNVSLRLEINQTCTPKMNEQTAAVSMFTLSSPHLRPRNSDESGFTAIGCATTSEHELEGSAMTFGPDSNGTVPINGSNTCT